MLECVGVISTPLLLWGSAAAARLKIDAPSGPWLYSAAGYQGSWTQWRVDVQGFNVTIFY